MSRYGGFRHFVLVVSGIIFPILAVVAFVSPEPPNTHGVFFALASIPTLASYAIYNVDNHGRGKTPRSRAQRLAARVLVGPIKPCGCWGDADAEAIERDHYVRRDAGGGGKVRFEARKRVLKRCHECGRHYHVDRSAKLKHVGDVDALGAVGDNTGHNVSKTLWRGVDVWPEDEPAAREAFTEPVEDT